MTRHVNQLDSRFDAPSACEGRSALAASSVLVGAAAGLIAVSLVGCTADQANRGGDRGMVTAVPEPRDVRVQFPENTASADPVPNAAPAKDDFAPTRLPINEIVGLIAQDHDQLGPRLAALKGDVEQANAAAAPGNQAPPAATPAPRTAPPAVAQSTPPAPPPQVQPAASAASPTPSQAPATPSAVAPAPAPTTPPPASPTPPPPSAVAESAKVLADAIAAAMQRNVAAADTKRSVGEAVAAALGAIADPAKPFDAATYPGLEDEERAFLAKLHEASAAMGRDLAAGKPIGEAVAVLAEAIKAVEPAPALMVKRSEFATKVEGFGQVTPIANRRFLPGRSNQVILYTELDGFTSDRNEKNEWVTSLATKVQILAKHDGTEVWSRNWQAVTVVSSVRRDDFFVCEKATLSEYLTVGTYILKVSVRDEKTQAIAERSVEFSMVADPALAAR